MYWITEKRKNMNVSVIGEETVFSELLATVPEIETIVRKKMAEEEIDEEDGMHIIFSFIIVPLLRDWCNTEKQTAAHIFDFFENMAHSDDTSVLEILDFSVLEPIADMDESDRKIIEKYMRTETMEQYQYIRDHMFR